MVESILEDIEEKYDSHTKYYNLPHMYSKIKVNKIGSLEKLLDYKPQDKEHIKMYILIM